MELFSIHHFLHLHSLLDLELAHLFSAATPLNVVFYLPDIFFELSFESLGLLVVDNELVDSVFYDDEGEEGVVDDGSFHTVEFFGHVTFVVGVRFLRVQKEVSRHQKTQYRVTKEL